MHEWRRGQGSLCGVGRNEYPLGIPNYRNPFAEGVPLGPAGCGCTLALVRQALAGCRLHALLGYSRAEGEPQGRKGFVLAFKGGRRTPSALDESGMGGRRKPPHPGGRMVDGWEGARWGEGK